MNRLLFLLLSAAIAVPVTAGITRASNHALRTAQAITWDFEDENQFKEFSCIDNDDDGFNWYYHNNDGLATGRMVTHSGDGLVCSASFDLIEFENLTPDNWLISPEVTLGGTLVFYAMGQGEYEFAEKFGVYVCVGTPTGVADFVQIAGDFTTAGSYREYEIDLSAYQGQVGHFAIVHHNTFSEFILNIDDITLDTGLRPHPFIPVVTVTSIPSIVSVAWNTGVGADNWRLRYRPWVDTTGNPIDCNFNDADYDLEKAGWTIRDADGDGKCWRLGNSDNNPANRYLYSQSYDWDAHEALTPDNYLISPEIKLQGFLRFTYWGDGIQEPGKDTFMVYAQIGEEMHPLATEDYVPTFEYETETIDLSQFGGQVGHIVFRHYNCHDEDALFLDDIFIGDPGAEIAVLAEWTEVNGLTEPKYTIHDLAPGTRYELQVMAYNEFFQSDWCKIIDFMTPEGSVEDYELGDVNYDFKVDIADVSDLIDYLLGDRIVFEPQADTYDDDRIDIADVTALADYLLHGTWPVVEPVFTVVGTANLFESDWDLNNERNNMTKGADGIYRLNKAGYFQQGTEIKFKVVRNHSYIHSWPAEERVIGIYETGAFSIDITFNPDAPDNQKISVDMNKVF